MSTVYRSNQISFATENGNGSHFKTSGYNPPRYLLDCLKETIERVECNQYSPPMVDTFIDTVNL